MCRSPSMHDACRMGVGESTGCSTVHPTACSCVGSACLLRAAACPSAPRHSPPHDARIKASQTQGKTTLAHPGAHAIWRWRVVGAAIGLGRAWCADRPATARNALGGGRKTQTGSCIRCRMQPALWKSTSSLLPTRVSASIHSFRAISLCKLHRAGSSKVAGERPAWEGLLGPSPPPSSAVTCTQAPGCSRGLHSGPWGARNPTPRPAVQLPAVTGHTSPPSSYHRGSHAPQMGQGMSLEEDRFGEVCRQLREASQREWQLHSEAAAEEAAGISPGYGSKQALYQAALQHSKQLTAEFVAIGDRLGGCCPSRLLLFGSRRADMPAVWARQYPTVPTAPTAPAPTAPCLQRPQGAAAERLVQSSLVPSKAHPCRVCCRLCSC